MSSSAVNRPSIALVDASIWSSNILPSAGMAMPRNAPANRPRAWTGCRRSWLAAARKVDFARFARSAMSFCRAQIFGQLCGSDTQEDLLPERLIRLEPESAHGANEDQDNRKGRLLDGIGGCDAGDQGPKDGRHKEGKEGRQKRTEHGDGRGRHS